MNKDIVFTIVLFEFITNGHNSLQVFLFVVNRYDANNAEFHIFDDEGLDVALVKMNKSQQSIVEQCHDFFICLK